MTGALALIAVFLLGTAGAASAAGELPDRSAQTNDVVRAIAYHGDTVYIGGNFTAVRPGGALAGSGLDVPRNHLAALDATTGDLIGHGIATFRRHWWLVRSGTARQERQAA